MSERGMCTCVCGPLSTVLWLPKPLAVKGMDFYIKEVYQAKLGLPVIRGPMGDLEAWKVVDVYTTATESKLKETPGREILPTDAFEAMNTIGHTKEEQGGTGE